jgi:uncharacterized protein (DUF302 family)
MDSKQSYFLIWHVAFNCAIFIGCLHRFIVVQPSENYQQGNCVFYIVESDKSFYEVTVDLEAVIPRLGFVTLQVHDFSETLRRKGIDLDDECKVFEICNYRQMEKLLTIDLRLSMALPWRISVFTEDGATKIGVIRPEAMLTQLSESEALSSVAREIEEKMIQIVDETR